MTIFDDLANQLIARAPATPRTVQIVGLPQPSDNLEHATQIARRWGTAMGCDMTTVREESRRNTIVLHTKSGARATLFPASGALTIRSAIGSFDELYDVDPGDATLTGLAKEWAAKLQTSELLNKGDRLEFERLWRVKARAAGRDLRLSEPVLCRAVGAFRHMVHDLPVLGRASVHVEMTGAGNLATASMSLRRLANNHDEVVAIVKPRDAVEAANEVAHNVARKLGGTASRVAGKITAENFYFGYVSFGRRRAQAVLAPMYIAAVTITGDSRQTRSAHLIAVSGTEERYVKVPSGSSALATARTRVA